MNLLTVQISDFDTFGRCVASFERPDGRVVTVAVPGTIPGETVVLDPLFRDPKGTCRYEGRLSSVVVSSPDRVEPRCPHFGVCGGCVWQHIRADHQLTVKQAWIDKLFDSLRSEKTSVHPIIGSPSPWGYRNKMEFSFSQDREGKHFLGLFKGSHRRGVENISVCPITGAWMGNALQGIREWWSHSGLDAYRPSSDAGSLMTATMRESATMADRMVVLTVSGNPSFALKQQHLDSFVAMLRETSTPSDGGELSIVLRIRQIAKKMPTQFYEMMLSGPDHIREVMEIEPVLGSRCTLEVHISPQSFFQPNTRQAMTIYSRALQMADLCPNDVLMDLYCGIGIFGMAASTVVQQAIGVELSRESAYDAKTNSSRLGCTRFSVVCGDVAALVGKKNALHNRPSKIIIDPPRSGLTPQAINEILSLEPDRLIYVSCNPETQARDAAVFLEQGWGIHEMQAVDQFPHTAHVEHIIRLDKV